ncbi:hypothetical protein K449DRAFT_428982 [Hypoxylon sp. EC38]|nr:hypothetical protein K449DRAFT_428982 [Hypoxylon sp. EC38]
MTGIEAPFEEELWSVTAAQELLVAAYCQLLFGLPCGLVAAFRTSNWAVQNMLSPQVQVRYRIKSQLARICSETLQVVMSKIQHFEKHV